VFDWLKKFLMHHVLYAVLLLVLCLGIFPFIVLYAGSMSIAKFFDRFSKSKKLAEKVDRVWTKIGVPYDYLVQTAG